MQIIYDFFILQDPHSKLFRSDRAGAEAAFRRFKQQWEQLKKTSGPEE